MDKKIFFYFLILLMLFYVCILFFYKYFMILFLLQVCYLKIDYNNGKVFINKGCIIDMDCVNREKQNVNNCYSQDGLCVCFYCCFDDLCNGFRFGSKYFCMSFLKYLKDLDDLIFRFQDQEVVIDFSQNLYIVLLFYLNLKCNLSLFFYFVFECLFKFNMYLVID